MPQEKCSNESGAECGAGEGVDDGWVIRWPRLDVNFEGEDKCSGVRE